MNKPEIKASVKLVLQLMLLLLAKSRALVTYNDTSALLSHLLDNYDTRIRPSADQSKPTIVNMSYTLTMLRSFNDLSGEIDLLSIFGIAWLEERMVWDPTLYAGIEAIRLPLNDIWHPLLHMPNSLNGAPGRGADTVSVTYRGVATIESLDLTETECTVDVTLYPFDKQMCSMAIKPSGYKVDELILNIDVSDSSQEEDIARSSEWQIQKPKLSIQDDGHVFVISIVLNRRESHTLLTMSVPVHVISFLNAWVFILPPESGERISYSITTFLALTVYMSILSDHIPRGSFPMAYMLYEVFIMLIYSVVILLTTICSLCLHLKVGKKAVPGYIKALISVMTCNGYSKTKTTPSVTNSTMTIVEPLPQTWEDCKNMNDEDAGCCNMDVNNEVSWTDVGNVFDNCMMTLFIVWFIVVKLCYFTMYMT